jgi:hypothetical protein
MIARSQSLAELAGFGVVTWGAWELAPIAGIFVAGAVLLLYGNRR